MKNLENNDKILKQGKIYINEFWSEKYQQQILKDSKIQESLESMQGLIRKNISDLVDDVHGMVKKKYGDIRSMDKLN